MSNQEGPKKTMYHGELRRLSPVTVKVVSGVLPSTKKKGSRYVELNCEGRLRYYEPENDACAEFFNGLKGQELAIVAEGDRQDATITAVGKPGSAVPQPPPKKGSRPEPESPPDDGEEQPPPPPRTVSPPAHRTAADDPLADMKRHIGRNRTAAMIALKAASSIADSYEKETREPMPVQLFCCVYESLLFGVNSRPSQQHLPLNVSYHDLLPVPKEGK